MCYPLSLLGDYLDIEYYSLNRDICRIRTGNLPIRLWVNVLSRWDFEVTSFYYNIYRRMLVVKWFQIFTTLIEIESFKAVQNETFKA